MANTGMRGIDVVQPGNAIVVESLQTSAGAALVSPAPTLQLMEIQTDGTTKTYDWTTNTFKTSGMSNGGQTVTMTNRTILSYSGGDSAQNIGLFTYALTTLTGFTRESKYLAVIQCTGADAPIQIRKFQYGGAEGDLAPSAAGKLPVTVAAGDLAPGAVGVAQFAADLLQLLTRRATSTGVTNPVTADTYQVYGFRSDDSIYYKSTTLGTPIYIWNNGGTWVASTTLGSVAGPYFSGGSANGTLNPQNGATGVMTSVVHGNSVLAGFQPDQILPATDATGRVILQPTQTGVTIPNVTTVATTTNVTNAPTNGDLTNVMKASVAAAVWGTVITGSVQAGTILAGVASLLLSGLNSSLIRVLGLLAGKGSDVLAAADLHATGAAATYDNTQQSLQAAADGAASNEVTGFTQEALNQLGPKIAWVSQLNLGANLKYLEVVTGDTYSSSLGNAKPIALTGTFPADVSGWSVNLLVEREGVTIEGPATIQSSSTTQLVVSWSLSGADTAKLSKGDGAAQLRFSVGGQLVTVLKINACITEGLVVSS